MTADTGSPVPEAYDLAAELPNWVDRQDMPDGRTRLHLLRTFRPGDIHESDPYHRYRVIDLVTGRPVVSLWALDCDATAQWHDDMLDLTIQPGDLALCLDLSRQVYRVGASGWQSLDDLQPYVERAIGNGYGVDAKSSAAAPARDRDMRRAAFFERLPVAAPVLVIGTLALIAGCYLLT